MLIITFAVFFLSADFASNKASSPPSGMVDLVLKKTYTVTSLISIAHSFAPSEAEFHTPGALTDGQIGSATNFKDGHWQGYFRGGTRSVIINLGQMNTIHQMQERFIHCPSSGVYFPRKVICSLSVNSNHRADIRTIYSAIPITIKTVETQTYSLSNLNFKARYVKMTFTIDVGVFLDEFQVFGDVGVKDSTVFPKITPPPDFPNEYCPPGSPYVGGVRNMVQIYNGFYPADSTLGLNTVNELIPYVGYETTSYKIKYLMFDGFLFLPFVAAGAPSGGKYYCDLLHPTVKSDWQYYLDNTFNHSFNLSALNIAVGNVKKIIGEPSYKVKVEIAIPYPTPTATNFGDVNGDGVSENLSSLSDREKVIKWYINNVMKRWNSERYINLQLVGFYWYEESADFAVDNNEAAMLEYVGKYVKSLGKVFNWTPFYQASGFTNWNWLGFDAAIMQPNYVFHNFPEQVIGEATDLIKKLGMGMEIEIHWDAIKDSTYRSKYYAYINYGVTKGYMKKAVHMFYQNGGPGTFYESFKSANPAIRNIYEQTYKSIKGIYVPIISNVKQ